MSPSHTPYAPPFRAADEPVLPRPRRAVDLPTLREHTQSLLAAHVPLSLLLDLAEPHGPDSSGCYAREGGDTSWLQTG